MVLLLLGLAGAEGADFNYKQNGRDWPELNPKCGGPNQSPIDLRRDYGAYTYYDAKVENHTGTCANSVDATVTWWEDYHYGGYYLKPAGTCKFESTLAEKKYGSKADYWTSSRIEYHVGSEHTIDGKRFDLELALMSSATPLPGVTPAADEYAYHA